MTKNPFVNCKSRKRRKPRVVNTIPKGERPYCPRTMVRYDNTLIEYSTVWVCKMCMKMILKEEAVQPHIEECKKNFIKKPVVETIKTPLEESKYICEVCDKVFSRKVTLKQHQEVHNEKVPSDLESDVEEPLYVAPPLPNTNNPLECVTIDVDVDNDA